MLEFYIENDKKETHAVTAKDIREALLKYFQKNSSKPVGCKAGTRGSGSAPLEIRMTWSADDLRGAYLPPKKDKPKPAMQFTMTDLLVEAHMLNPKK